MVVTSRAPREIRGPLVNLTTGIQARPEQVGQNLTTSTQCHFLYSSIELGFCQNMTRTDTLSRRQVEGLIADGKSIIVVDQKVLKVDPWLKYHPGGDKAIMHMVGRDATDEVNA